ncbi:hypothetical protein CERSUDRAFT_100852 [Gelatoporia subvermispora B]|uniref:Uncharacterized protein n=1 Tax=Ceriporiopsis subvermispora (strain B) TaxID=914234 RepID=M2QWR4_CERS8|nr:hypothetical protein CERSUDRAFT_100852 [Gelatoporia subvermispora B]
MPRRAAGCPKRATTLSTAHNLSGQATGHRALRTDLADLGPLLSRRSPAPPSRLCPTPGRYRCMKSRTSEDAAYYPVCPPNAAHASLWAFPVYTLYKALPSTKKCRPNIAPESTFMTLPPASAVHVPLSPVPKIAIGHKATPAQRCHPHHASFAYFDRIADALPNTISISYPPITDSGVFKRPAVAIKGRANTGKLMKTAMTTAQVYNFIGACLVRTAAHYVPLLAVQDVPEAFPTCDSLLYEQLLPSKFMNVGGQNNRGGIGRQQPGA